MKNRPQLHLFGLGVALLTTLTSASAQTTLISTESTWLYVADGTDQGAAWASPGFDDSFWSNGVAKLGFGGNGEVTTVGDATNNYTTFYFRKTFTVPDASLVQSLVARMILDDGAVVYLNGVEAFRRNLPAGNVEFLTLAPVTVSDADETNFVTNLINPGLLVNGVNVLAAEVHQSATNSSDLGWEFELVASTNPPPLPAIVLTNVAPTDGPVGTNVNAFVIVEDISGVVQVDFFLDGEFAFRDPTSPYSVTFADLTAGAHTLTAVSLGNGGLSATSAPVNVTITNEPGVSYLVRNGSVWKYLDDGSNQGTAWQASSFDDSAWPSGPAELGFGDISDTPPRPERTVINGGPATNRIVTTYFRHTFNVPDPGAYSNLTVQLLRDDGGTVYLNGVEVFRSNMPTGNIDFLKLTGVSAPDDGTTYFSSTNLSPALLVVGQNLLAVEIHQSSLTSSDLSFDGMLLAQACSAPTVTCPANPTTNILGISVVMNYPDPTIADGALVGCTPPGGSMFPVGSSPVTCTATNACGTSTCAFNIIVNGAPVIITQPQNQIVPAGADATFTVVATGTPPLHYQWRFQGVPIVDATNSILTVLHVGAVDEGSYDVVVSNDTGSTTSGSAQLLCNWYCFMSLSSAVNPIYVCPGQSFSFANGTIGVGSYSTVHFGFFNSSATHLLQNLKIDITSPAANIGTYSYGGQSFHVPVSSGGTFSGGFTFYGDVPANAQPGDTDEIKLGMSDADGLCISTVTLQFKVAGLKVTPISLGGCCWNFNVTPACATLVPTDIVKIVAQVTGGSVLSASPIGSNPALVTPTTATWTDSAVSALSFPQNLNMCFECGSPAGITVVFTGYNAQGLAVATLNQTLTVNDAACKDTTPPTIITCPGPLTGIGPGAVIPDVTSLFSAATAVDNCSPFPNLTITQTPIAGAPASLGPLPFQNPMTHLITVTVKDAAGNSVTCPVNFTVRRPAVTATINDSGLLVIAWPPPPGPDPDFNAWYKLQEAGIPDGPWTTLEGATNPYTVAPTNTQRFFRLVWPNP